MKPDDPRDMKWLEYFLSDLPPEERDRVEKEIEGDPARADALKRQLEAMTSWAKESTPHSPIDMAALMEEIGEKPYASGAPILFRRALPWAVAAALLLVAVTQGNFNIQFGDSTFAWGTPPQSTEQVTQLQAEIATLTTSYEGLANENIFLQNQLLDMVGSFEQFEADMQFATNELARNQAREARTRYSDTQRILAITQGLRLADVYDNQPEILPASFNATQ